MKIALSLYILFISVNCFSQEMQVTTIVKNINASGGLAIDQEGNIYVSDFGHSFPDTSLTKVYKVEKGSWDTSVFAEGFRGASGCYMDKEGNFYQSNPKGNRVSRVYKNGQVIYDYIIDSLKIPVGVVINSRGELFICNCGKNNIIKVSPDRKVSVFSSGQEFFQCPNGLTINNDTLYVVNFNSDKVVKISPDGKPSILVEGLLTLTGGPRPVGLGHITYSNQYLYATAIGRGYIYRISMNGDAEIIAGNGQFKNADGPALEASFSKPNGIVASASGDTLYVNVSDPTWISNPTGLHPAHLVMITGLCSLPGSRCNVE